MKEKSKTKELPFWESMVHPITGFKEIGNYHRNVTQEERLKSNLKLKLKRKKNA